MSHRLECLSVWSATIMRARTLLDSSFVLRPSGEAVSRDGRSPLAGLIGVVCGTLCLAALAPLGAQDIPRRAGPQAQEWKAPLTADGQIDVQGYWRQTNNVTTYSLEQGEAHRAVHIKITGQRAATGRPIVDPPDGKIPYLPWAARKFQYLVSVHEGPERAVDLDPVARGFMEGVPGSTCKPDFRSCRCRTR